MTTYQTPTTVIAEMNGKRKRRRSSMLAASTRSTNESRASEKPSKGWANEVLCSHPNHAQSA